MTNDIVRLIFILHRQLEEIGDFIFSKYGLTVRDYETLLFIENKVKTTTELAQLLYISKAAVTHKTKLLEQRDLVKKKVNKDDKRSHYYLLTAKGKAMIMKLKSIRRKSAGELLKQFSNPEDKLVTTFLEKLSEHFSYVLKSKKNSPSLSALISDRDE